MHPATGEAQRRAGLRADKPHDERTWTTENTSNRYLLTTCNAQSSVSLAGLQPGLRTEARYTRLQHHTSAQHLLWSEYPGPKHTLHSWSSPTVSLQYSRISSTDMHFKSHCQAPALHRSACSATLLPGATSTRPLYCASMDQKASRARFAACSK